MPLNAQLRERLISIIAARRDEMIADLARHVAIPTGHNHAPGLDAYRAIVVARLEALGSKSECIAGEHRPDWLSEPADGPPKRFDPPPTALCRRPVAGRPRILLSGHLDTVFDPRGSFQVLNITPDGKSAVGPGVVDMKGGILIALVALEALESMCVPVSWSFILNSDEETGSYASDRALRAAAKDHDLGLALEPALPNGGLAVERKGSAQFIIEAFGKSAHAGRDFEKGASAVYALARAVTRCEAMTDLSRGLTVNIGPLKGGPATNIVPDYAAAWGNVRFKDAEAAREIDRALRALNTDPVDAEAEESSTKLRVASPEASKTQPRRPSTRVRTSFARPAKPLTPETRHLAERIRAVADSLGQPLPFGSSGGVCDGNNLQDAGLPTLDTLGVRGGGLHTHQEWIELDSLTQRATLLACVLAELSE